MVLEDRGGGIHMNRWRVGEDRGSKEMDGCPLTVLCTSFTLIYIFTLDFPWLDLSGVFSLE
jgi:hypothetical protein